MDSNCDHYRILGVPRDASPKTIRKAYKELARKWHPDKNLESRDVAEINFKKISNSYKILSGQSRDKSDSHKGSSNHGRESSSYAKYRRHKYDEKFFRGETARDASEFKRKHDLIESIGRKNQEMMEKYIAAKSGRTSSARCNAKVDVSEILPELDDNKYEVVVLKRLKSMFTG